MDGGGKKEEKEEPLREYSLRFLEQQQSLNSRPTDRVSRYARRTCLVQTAGLFRRDAVRKLSSAAGQACHSVDTVPVDGAARRTLEWVEKFSKLGKHSLAGPFRVFIYTYYIQL